MASRLVKADGTLTSLPRKKVKIQHVASVLHPKICSYFSTMTCHVLVMPLSECQKIRRRSRGMPCVNKNPPLTALLKNLFQQVFAGPCE